MTEFIVLKIRTPAHALDFFLSLSHFLSLAIVSELEYETQQARQKLNNQQKSSTLPQVASKSSSSSSSSSSSLSSSTLQLSTGSKLDEGKQQKHQNRYKQTPFRPPYVDEEGKTIHRRYNSTDYDDDDDGDNSDVDDAYYYYDDNGASDGNGVVESGQKDAGGTETKTKEQSKPKCKNLSL